MVGFLEFKPNQQFLHNLCLYNYINKQTWLILEDGIIIQLK